MITQLQKRYENENPVGITYEYPAFGIMVFDILEDALMYEEM